MDKPSHNISQLRRDPVSGDWAVIATGRAKRPHEFKSKEKAKKSTVCPFEEPEKNANEVVFTLEHEGYKDGWWVKVIKNKFPIVEGTICGVEVQNGPYTIQEGAGYHEVIITRDHDRSLAQMTSEEVLGVVNVYIERYKKLQELDCANYILVFHNHGVEAGASLPHPHSQIIAVPVIPPDVRRSLVGSEKYYEEKGECVHCAMLAWERDEKVRIVYENAHMIVISPYVPRDEFEVRIYPKVHSSFVQKSSQEEITSLAEALRVTLKKIHISLSNPAYNFFLHTAPARDSKHHDHYHWHVEILPKPPTPHAGFEMGTGIDVSMVDPDEVATYLRDTSI